MKKLVEIGILFDYYGKLLSDKQFNIVQAYYEDDLSLNEIADLNDISKQAVSMTLKRAEKKLNDYEDTLHLIQKFQQIEIATKKTIEFIDPLIEQDMKNRTEWMIIRKELKDTMGRSLEDVKK